MWGRVPPHGRHRRRLIHGRAAPLHGERVGAPRVASVLVPLRHGPTSVPIVYWNGLGPGFALHGAELAYKFSLPGGFTTNINFYPPVKDVPTHRYLSRVMVSKWIAFAHSGNPNAVEGEWSYFESAGSNTDLLGQSRMPLTGRHTVNRRPTWFSMRRTRPWTFISNRIRIVRKGFPCGIITLMLSTTANHLESFQLSQGRQRCK